MLIRRLISILYSGSLTTDKKWAESVDKKYFVNDAETAKDGADSNVLDKLDLEVLKRKAHLNSRI
jgi:hypothetical protein